MILEIFKKWHQITVGDLSHVSSPTCSDSKFSFHAEPRQNACRLTHGIHWDFRKTFSVINFLRLIHSEIILKDFTLAHHKENKDQFHKQQGQGLFFTRDDEQNRDTIPMPTFAGRPLTMSSTMSVELSQNSMVGQQRQQISELQFDRCPDPQSFLVWKIRFKKSSDYLF